MTKEFSASAPIIALNALKDQSVGDEQHGFMMLFASAIAVLRNPQAYGLIEDDPVKALELGAFVSLLAGILRGATRL